MSHNPQPPHGTATRGRPQQVQTSREPGPTATGGAGRPRRRGHQLAALLVAATAVATLAPGARAAKDDLVLVSRANGAGGAAGGASSTANSISADGRLVVFSSRADNLSDDDGNNTEDVFVRDLVTNTTTLVSRGDGANGAAGDADSANGSVSADGRLVVFSSVAKNLGDDQNGASDIFVRDLIAKTTTLVSRAGGATGAAGGAGPFEASITADGRAVAFESLANNLSTDDKDGSRATSSCATSIAKTTTLVQPGGRRGGRGRQRPLGPGVDLRRRARRRLLLDRDQP